MCWNCGCMMPDNDMGNPDNITTGKIIKAAKAGGNKNVKQVMETMIKTYQKKVKGTPVLFRRAAPQEGARDDTSTRKTTRDHATQDC